MSSPLRTILKRVVKRGALGLAPMLSQPRPASRILTYHSIGEFDHPMNVGPKNFMEQMAWLAENAAVITLDEAADAKPGIAITFDDGYRDNLVNAAPVLARHAFPAVVFVVAGKMGGPLLGEADPLHGRLMTWDEVRELRALGAGVGGHTLTHPRLSLLSVEQQREEIIGSCDRIASELAEGVRWFAYPYGTSADYNETSKRLVREAGCTVACSNRYGYNVAGRDRLALKRIWVDATDTLKSFAAKVNGNLDVLCALDSHPGMLARRILRKIA